MTILMQRYAHTPARLSLYFTSGILRPRQKSERGRFFFLMIVEWMSDSAGELPLYLAPIQKAHYGHSMTKKEKDAAKILLAMNAVKFLALGEPPISSSMKIAPADMMGCMMATRSGDPKAMCAGGIVAYYMNAENGVNASAADYPDLYRELEDKLLGNNMFRDFLSAVADGYNADGDSVPQMRLKNKGAYVESSMGKTQVIRELGIKTSKGFFASLFS